MALFPELPTFKESGVDIEWDRHQAGILAVETTGKTLPPELLDSVTRNRVALKGPVSTPVGQGFTSVNVGLRQALDPDELPEAVDDARRALRACHVVPGAP